MYPKSRLIRRKKNVPKKDIQIQATPSQIDAAMAAVQLCERQNLFREYVVKRIEMKSKKNKNLFVSGDYDEYDSATAEYTFEQNGKLDEIIWQNKLFPKKILNFYFRRWYGGEKKTIKNHYFGVALKNKMISDSFIWL